jgi:hypothetical protein
MDESLFECACGCRPHGGLCLSRTDVLRGWRVVVSRCAVALYAAALTRESEVYADHPLVSYRALTTSDRYLHGASIMLRDVLLRFDLPQVAAAIPGQVTLISPVDQMNRPVEFAAARAQYPERVRIAGDEFQLD